jgi:hypothetical protein
MSSVIGQAIIEVVSSGGPSFTKSVESETGAGLAAAENAASASGTKIGTNLKGKFSSAFSGISTTAKVALGAGLLTVFHSGLGEVEDYQKGLAQLQQGLKTTGNVAGLTAPQMEDLASNIQDYSGQTDDSIVKTEQLLLTFTNIRNEAGKGNDVFTQTTKIAADMAARLGGDASTAAIQLGKAMNDPIKGVTALSRVGVSFTQQQKDQIAALVQSGNTMGAQKIILGELTKEFGGSAEAVGKTLPGQIEIGKRKFEDFSQSLVTAFMPIFTQVINLFTAVMPVISALAPILAPLAIAILAVVAATKAWNIAQTAFNFIMKEGSLTTGGWITVIALLVVGIIEAYKHSKTFRDIVHAALHDVEAAFHAVKVAVSAMKDAFLTAVNAIVGFVKEHWPLLLSILTGPVGAAVIFIVRHFGQIEDAAQSIWHAVSSVFGKVVNFISGMPGKISSAASGMWDGIKEAFRAAINFIIDGWNSLHFHIPGFHKFGIGFDGFDLGVPQIPHMATGGNLNGLALVGEFGPELVAGSGTVFNRHETQQMIGGSGVVIHPGAFSIVIQGSADKDMVQEALDHWSSGLAQALRRRGVVNA